MDITVQAEKNHTLIRLEGRLEATQANEANEAIKRALEAGPPNLIMDCSALNYVASMGLRCFLLAHKGAQGAGGKLIFFGLNENVRSVFAMTGFDKMAQVRTSLEEALDSLG
ncbi:MAG: STAS domain-containing protein [Deltaproteobacteria bacterium]|jgi:anti-anti-sigma factor|nr:STAS domain-containing protein [Deltaproteobacteria bacterium]